MSARYVLATAAPTTGVTTSLPRGRLPFQSGEPCFVSVCRAPSTSQVLRSIPVAPARGGGCSVVCSCVVGSRECVCSACGACVRTCVCAFHGVTVCTCVSLIPSSWPLLSAVSHTQRHGVTSRHDSDAGVLPHTVGKTWKLGSVVSSLGQLRC